MTMNEKLCRLAEKRNMAAVARLAGIHPSVVNKCVRNKQSTLNYRMAFALAKALDVSPTWLLDDSKSWPPIWETSTEASPNAA